MSLSQPSKPLTSIKYTEYFNPNRATAIGVIAAIYSLGFAGQVSANQIYSGISTTNVTKFSGGVSVTVEQDQDADSSNDGSPVVTESSSSQGRSSATISSGVLKVFARAENPGPQSQNAFASGTASIRDDITVQSLQAIDGRQGYARGYLYVHLPEVGNTASATQHSGNADASANAGLTLLGPNGSVPLFSYVEQSSLFANFTDVYVNTSVVGSHGRYAVDIPIIVGQSFTLEMRATATARTLNVNGSAVADLANSFYWGGLQSITVDGLTITDFSAVGAGGVDWKASYIVPLPTSALFLATGLLGLTRMAIRKRS